MGYTSFLGLPQVPPLVLQTIEVYCLPVLRLEVLNQGVNRTGCLGGLGGCPTPLSYIWSSQPFLGLSMVLSLYLHNCEVQIPPMYEDTIYPDDFILTISSAKAWFPIGFNTRRYWGLRLKYLLGTQGKLSRVTGFEGKSPRARLGRELKCGAGLPGGSWGNHHSHRPPVGPADLETGSGWHVESTSVSQKLGFVRQALRTTVNNQHVHWLTENTCRENETMMLGICMTFPLPSPRQMCSSGESVNSCVSAQPALVPISTAGPALFRGWGV